jgi:Mg2+ and Co2+ transporter CorA
MIFANLLPVFLRDVLDNLENYDEEVKNLIRECANVDSEAEKCQQQQVDSTLYVLTVISAVFLPAQFLTGYVTSMFLKQLSASLG